MAIKIILLLTFITIALSENEMNKSPSARIAVADINLNETLQAFDPIEWLPDIKVNLNKLQSPKLASGKFELEKLVLEGFKDTRIQVDVGLSSKLDIESKKISLHVHYFIDGQFLQLVNIRKDHGTFELTLENVKISCALKFNPFDWDEIVSIDFQKIEGIPNIQLTGLFEDDNLSELIGGDLKDIIDILIKDDSVTNIARNFGNPLINALLFALNITPNKIMPKSN